MASHIEPLDTRAGRRYKAVVSIGSGRGAKRLTRTERTYAAAERALARLEAVACGEAPRRDYTIGEIMAGWLDHLDATHQVEPQTLARYRQIVAHFAGTSLNRARVSAVSTAEIERVLANGPGGDETKRLRWRVLRAGLRWGSRSWHTLDPTPGVRPPRAARTRRAVLDGDGLRALIENCAVDSLLDPFVTLAVVTGKRRNEVLGLRVGDIDPVTGAVRVDHALEWLPGRPWRLKRTKTGEQGVVHLPAFVLEEIRDLCRARFNRPDAFLCSLDGGRNPLDPREVSLAFRKRADALGLPDLRVHDLRHSFATILTDAGLSQRHVQHALDHADIRTTARYQHPQGVAEVVAETMQRAIHGDSMDRASVSGAL